MGSCLSTNVKQFYLYILVYLIFIKFKNIAGANNVRFSSEAFSEMSPFANLGKQHLESFNQKSNVPQYGPCWKRAVLDLKNGCKGLSEHTQSELALRFTDCFLQMSGSEPLNCLQKEDCLPLLSDRAFNAYTEFYTYTQSICYFLQSQIWHEEAEMTIDKLSSTSAHVSKQLEDAEATQAALLSQQQQSIQLQKDLVMNLAEAMQNSQNKIAAIMKDFNSYTNEHKKALFDVFDQLATLKTWAIGEVSWIDSILFYTSSVLVSFLFTSASRTQHARFYIYLLLTINYLIERYIFSLNTKSDSKQSIYLTYEMINSYIWICRRIFVFLSIIITLIIAYNFQDFNKLNYKLLCDIKKQNNVILNKVSEPKVKDKANKNVSCPDDTYNVIPLPYSSLSYEEVTENQSMSKQRELISSASPTPININNKNGSGLNKIENLQLPIHFEHNCDDNMSRSSRSSTPLRRSTRIMHKTII